jgi:NAD(P) transhydrogenase
MSTTATAELDLLVVGSGPAGQKAAIQAAKLGKRVAVVERPGRVGGNSIHTGTIPSKTLREAVLDHLAQGSDDIDPLQHDAAERGTLHFLMDRAARVTSVESTVVREQFRRNGVGVLFGEAAFTDPHTLAISGGDHTAELTADYIVLATGAQPARPAGVEFDDRRVIDSDGLLRLQERVPRTMTVVGAGVTGVEYASMFGRLGTRVTLVDRRSRTLPFLDGEICEALQFLLRRNGVTFRLGEAVAGVEVDEQRALTHLESGKSIASETVLWTSGREGCTARLALERAGLSANERGNLAVDADHRTAVPHIFAVGDVAGGHGLAATAFEQGRRAALRAFGRPVEDYPQLVPTGIYTIPEVGMVGRTEEELTEEAVPYVLGAARWSELARGVMSGDEDGLLKLLVSPRDHRLLGVHVIGTGGTELVHIGQTAMALDATVDLLVGSVFNYPTFAESYRVAALDAANRIDAVDRPATYIDQSEGSHVHAAR